MTHAQQPSLPTLLVPPEAQLGALPATFPVLPTPHEHPRSQPCPGLAARAEKIQCRIEAIRDDGVLAVIDGLAADAAPCGSGCSLHLSTIATAARASAGSWPR